MHGRPVHYRDDDYLCVKAVLDRDVRGRVGVSSTRVEAAPQVESGILKRQQPKDGGATAKTYYALKGETAKLRFTTAF